MSEEFGGKKVTRVLPREINISVKYMIQQRGN